MRLLFVHQNLGDFGGAETFVRTAARELGERGHEAWLLHREATGRNEPHWEKVFKKSFCLPKQGDIEALGHVLDEAAPDLVFVNNWEDLETLEVLINSKIPVARMVHDHSLYCMRGYKYNVFTRRICRRPASLYCVLPCLGFMTRNPRKGLPVRWGSYAAKRREIRVNRGCAAVLAYSEYQREELIGNGFRPERIHLTRPIRVCNPEGLKASYGDRNLILFAGQIIRGKGVDALLRALAQVRVHFECLILGDGNHRPKCEKLCKSLGLDHKVHFQGYVLPEELRAFYLQATVFAVSSLWPEPFGMVGPEAMRYGLPVVAFDAGAIGEWLRDGETGFLVPWNDTSAYAARIEQLLCNKGLAQELGTRAMRWVQRFDTTKEMDKLERLLVGLTGGRSSPTIIPRTDLVQLANI